MRALLAGVLAAGLLAAPAAAADTVPGEVIVRFADDVAASERAEVRRRHDARVRRTVLDERHQVLRVHDVKVAVAGLRADPGVAYAEPNQVYTAAAVPDDARLGEQWALPAINAPAAWDRTTGSSAVSVGVADTGVASGHPDLAAHVAAGERDANGHGTRVAGVLGAQGNNGLGIAGVTWRVGIVPLHALDASGRGDSVSVAAAFARAGRLGLPIVNASLGGPPSELVADAIEGAPDTLFVAAAGNDGASVYWEPTYPCAYTFENVLCVGASDRTGGLASFSNFGEESVDLLAPGVDVLAPQPERRTVLADDFEQGRLKWRSGGDGDRWGISSRWSSSPGHSLADSPDGDHGPNVRSYAENAAPLDLTGLGDCRIDFSFQARLAPMSRLYLHSEVPGVQTPSLWLNFVPERVSLELPWVDGRSGVRLRFSFSSGEADGDGVYIDDLRVSCVDPLLTPSGYAPATGTSFAAPLVAGAAALRRTLYPGESPALTKAAILDSVTKRPDLAGVVASGGTLDVRAALDATPAPLAGPLVGTIRTLARGPEQCCSDASNPRVLADGTLVFQTREGMRQRRADGTVVPFAAPRVDVALPGGGYVYADNYGDRIVQVDARGEQTVLATAERPTSVARAPDGTLYYIARPGLYQLRVGGVPRAIVTGGTRGWTEGARGQDVSYLALHGVEVSENGEPLVIVDDSIWRVGSDDRVYRVAGRPNQPGYTGEGGPALAALLRPTALTRWPGVGLLVTDGSDRVRLIDRWNRIWTVAGSAWKGFRGDGEPALRARLNQPYGATILPGGGFAFGDALNNRIRGVDAFTPPPAPTPTRTPTPTPSPTASPSPAPTSAPTPDGSPEPAPPVPALAPPTASPRPAVTPRARLRLTAGRRLQIDLPAGASADVRCTGKGCRTRQHAFRSGPARRVQLRGPRGTRFVLTVRIRYADGAQERTTVRARTSSRRCRASARAPWGSCAP